MYIMLNVSWYVSNWCMNLIVMWKYECARSSFCLFTCLKNKSVVRICLVSLLFYFICFKQENIKSRASAYSFRPSSNSIELIFLACKVWWMATCYHVLKIWLHKEETKHPNATSQMDWPIHNVALKSIWISSEYICCVRISSIVGYQS